MKKYSVLFLCFLCACAGLPGRNGTPKYRVRTERGTPYYLSADPEKVEDTCPRHDIIKPYTCTADMPDGFTCLDVSMVQGRPVATETYQLLQQSLQPQTVTAQPECPKEVSDCDSFLQALNYNLEFSWYLVNFPTSSFEQCRETYDCKRIDCYQAMPVAEGADPQSTLISCVYKKNQLFFVGSDITCHKTLR